jgi:hypothetical protein
MLAERVDDVVWGDELDVYSAVRRLGYYPFGMNETKAYARSKADEHHVIWSKLSQIIAASEATSEALVHLRDHHIKISSRYTRAAAAFGD